MLIRRHHPRAGKQPRARMGGGKRAQDGQRASDFGEPIGARR